MASETEKVSQKILDFYKEFPDDTAELIAVRSDLDDSDLVGIGKLTKITLLHLSENRLKTIPRDLCKLTNLTELNLGGNAFETIPAELFQLTGLLNLYLDGNNFEFIPLELKNLTQLEDLCIHACPKLIFPPKEILEEANAYADKTWDEWAKLGFHSSDHEIIQDYMRTKEAEELYAHLFPSSKFAEDISKLFLPSESRQAATFSNLEKK